MTPYVSILRGINVGGRRKILMVHLRELYQSLGFKNVITYIQSGNVIFNYFGSESIRCIENNIQNAIQKEFGHDVPVIIRSKVNIENSIKNNPFIDKSGIDISQLGLIFLNEIPTSENINKLMAFNVTPDSFKIIDNNVFIFVASKSIDSKLTIKLFENKLGVKATNRNWKTVTKLYEHINDIKYMQ